MNAKLRRRALEDVAWMGGAALFCVAVVGGALSVVEARRASVHELRQSLQAMEQRLESEVALGADAATLAAARGELEESRRAVESDSVRIAHLSSVARGAGVELVHLRSGTSRLSEDGRVLARTHRLSVEGGYRELAAFLDGVPEGAGVVGIEELEIEPVAEPELAPRHASETADGRLRASLVVAWFARVTDGGEQ